MLEQIADSEDMVCVAYRNAALHVIFSHDDGQSFG
jgi:hypothetical protein